MVWDHLDVNKVHVAYAVIAVFTVNFMLISLFVKEKLYLGEATVSTIYGLIVGPHCLGWFEPAKWGNLDFLTLEISRIVLVVQIFAGAVEMPKKYFWLHKKSVFMMLVPNMTAGWLIMGAFIYLLIPGINFASSLIISGCITATDPVLASAVVGKGKFARRVPRHLRNLISAESIANDGMAFPFIYLGLHLVMHHGHPGEIIKDWIVISILYECVLAVFMGVIIGYVGRHAIKYAERKELIDKESFLAFYIVLALFSAGFGSMLGVDDLLVSFAAGTSFSWDTWFAKKTEDAHVSDVIDLLLNMSYFIYFGAIVPWEQFNNPDIGCNVWRLIILALVMIFLRRIPAVLALKPWISDIKTWREAIFCGHFGPIGVGSVFATMIAKGELESMYTTEETPTAELPAATVQHYRLIACIWPIVSFLVISSILVHGSSVAVMTLGKRLNTMALSMTMSFTVTTDNDNGPNWINRLPKLESTGRAFSLQRVDTKGLKRKKSKSKNDEKMGSLNLTDTSPGAAAGAETPIETSGVKYRPAGGMKRKSRKDRRRNRHTPEERREYLNKNRPQAEQFDLTQLHEKRNYKRAEQKDANNSEACENDEKVMATADDGERVVAHVPDAKNVEAYEEGDKVFFENKDGEVLKTVQLQNDGSDEKVEENSSSTSGKSDNSAHENARERKKVFAYKVGNDLVIENEDGEVLRRYEIHKHDDNQEIELADKDGQFVLKSRPRSDSLLNKTLGVVGLKKRPTAVVAEVEEEVGDEDSDEDSGDNSDEDEDSDEGEPETTVEKQRRLAALGKGSTRNENDEER